MKNRFFCSGMSVGFFSLVDQSRYLVQRLAYVRSNSKNPFLIRRLDRILPLVRTRHMRRCRLFGFVHFSSFL